MLRRFGSAALGMALALSLALPATAQQSGHLGVWRNPKNTVHVDIRPCGYGICGVVIWASPEAIEAARKGGSVDLIGQQLFRDFVEEKPGVWRGKVFVPDKNRTFSGSATLTASGALQARGCIIAGVLCRSQLWKRVDPPAS